MLEILGTNMKYLISLNLLLTIMINAQPNFEKA